MGKTALGLNIAHHVGLKTDKAVGFFSMEMSESQIVNRLLCAEAQIDIQKTRTGYLSDRDFEKLKLAGEALSQARIFIDESAALTVMEMKAKCRRLKMEQRLDIVFVDYIQLMRTGGRFENRNQEMSFISRSLKELAKELHMPVVGISQLSRAPEKGRREPKPMLSDLRESGAIEQDADVVIFIYRPEILSPGRRDRPGHRRGQRGQAEERPDRRPPAGLHPRIRPFRGHGQSPRITETGRAVKDKTVFICQGCGARSPKWMGRCSACGEWNTLVEEIEEEAAGAGGTRFAPTEPVLYKDVQDIPRQRIAVGIEDFNKVLGGGLVSGSVVLLGGEPGIGKSTLLLQVARDMAAGRSLGPLRLGRGVPGADQAPGRPAGRPGRAALPPGRDQPRAHPGPGRAPGAEDPHRRFDPDRLLGQDDLRPGDDQPGPRGGQPDLPLRQDPADPDLPRRPHHQGRDPGRPEVPRAHRRRRPPVRGGAGPQPPRPAGHEEPLRARLGAGRLRDDRRGAPAHPQPLGLLPPGTPARGARQRGRLHGQGHPAAPRRDPGPRLVDALRRQPAAHDHRPRPLPDGHAAGPGREEGRLQLRRRGHLPQRGRGHVDRGAGGRPGRRHGRRLLAQERAPAPGHGLLRRGRPERRDPLRRPAPRPDQGGPGPGLRHPSCSRPGTWPPWTRKDLPEIECLGARTVREALDRVF